MRTTPTKGILERLKDGIVIGAEGYVFELERRGYIKAGPYVPEVVLDFPEAIKELHREFLRAGSEVIVALTYYAHREKLKDVSRENDLECMNRQAVRIANEVAREGGALVTGDICNTWAYDPDNAKETGKIVRAMYEEQLTWAVEEGIDFVISETNDYLGAALIALEVIQQFKLPAMVTLASVQKDQTRDAYDYVEACKRPIYFSDVVVRRESRYTSFGDLEGCIWAYNEGASHSGCNLVCYSLLERGESPHYFGKTLKTGSHHASLQAVLEGRADATALDSHMLDVFLLQHEDIAAQLRVIAMLGPSTIPSVVVSKRLDAALKCKLREVLCTMHQDSVDTNWLKEGLIDRFVPIADEQYRDLREMFARVQRVEFPFE